MPQITNILCKQERTQKFLKAEVQFLKKQQVVANCSSFTLMKLTIIH